jgi:drug/metabolite transporter (DMT)-like permease
MKIDDKSNTNNKIYFYILMVFAMLFWGSSWISVKVLGRYISYKELVFYRYFITTITLIPVIVYLKYSFSINIRNFFLSGVASIMLLIYTLFFYFGTKYGTAGLGGALVTTTIPIVTFVLLVLFFKKKIFKKDLFALALGVVGVLTILNIWQLSIQNILNSTNLLFMLCAVSWALLTIVNKKSDNINAIVFSFYIYLISTVIGFVMSDFSSGNILDFDYIFWLNLIIISVLSTTFATSVYFVAIKHIGTSQASAFIFLVPFFAISISFIFLGENISSTTIIGTILTIIAVYILNKTKTKL